MIVLLCGDDRFARVEALSGLRRRYDEDGGLKNNTVQFDAPRLRLEELRRAVGAAPFLGAWRLVRVDGLCGRFQRGGRRGLGEWEGLAEVLAEAPATTLLIFTDDAVPARNPIRAQIEAAGEVREFAPLREREALQWLREQVRARGLQLTRGAANALVERAAGDRGILTGAVEKLELYAGAAGVDEAIVDLLVPQRRNVRIFDLLDAVAERRLADAMRALDAVRAGGEDGPRILHMLARQYRQIVIASELIEEGEGQQEIAAALGAPPWLARRVHNQARAYRPEQADRALERILEADAAIIAYRRGEGGLTDDLAVELLVADLAGAGAAGGAG